MALRWTLKATNQSLACGFRKAPIHIDSESSHINTTEFQNALRDHTVGRLCVSIPLRTNGRMIGGRR